MPRSSIILLAPLLVPLAGCREDPAAEQPEGACPITARVKLAAPPEGWMAAEHGIYTYYRFDEIVLFSFDEEEDPERAFWRLDRCTGAVTPFPALQPGMFRLSVRDTPAGRVLYARSRSGDFLLDRLDVPGDDGPIALAGLPPPDSLIHTLWDRPGISYAFFIYSDEVYTHAGDPNEPVKRVAQGIEWVVPLLEELLVLDDGGALRLVDPYTGESETVLVGVEQAFPAVHRIDSDETSLLWRPAGDPRIYVRRLGTDEDVPLDVEPSTTIDHLARWDRDGSFLYFEGGTGNDALTDVVRIDTGVAVVVPEHVDNERIVDGVTSLVLSESPEVVAALWEPQTGALREWYRGPGPVPRPQSYDGASLFYYVEEPGSNPPIGSLWRVEPGTGDRRVVLGRYEPSAEWLDARTVMLRFGVGPSLGAVWADQLFDLKLADLQTGIYTPIAENVSEASVVPGEGVLYLDAHGSEPGLWAVPLP